MAATEHLSNAVKITQACTVTEGAAAQTAITGATLDMSGYSSVLIVVSFGIIVAGAVTSIKAQMDDDPAWGTVADIEGSNQTINATTGDDTAFFIDVIRPPKRYVRVVVSRATQNATVGSILYIQYGAKKKPVTNTGVVSGEAFVDAVGGTA